MLGYLQKYADLKNRRDVFDDDKVEDLFLDTVDALNTSIDTTNKRIANGLGKPGYTERAEAANERCREMLKNVRASHGSVGGQIEFIDKFVHMVHSSVKEHTHDSVLPSAFGIENGKELDHKLDEVVHYILDGLHDTGEDLNTPEQDTNDEMFKVIPVEISELATTLVMHADELEPKFTKDVTGVANETGGQMFKLEFKKKSRKSVEEKILRTKRDHPELSNHECAEQIRDLVRYTVVYEDQDYAKQVNQAQHKLFDMGYALYDHKAKKYFKPGDSYFGYNTTVIDKLGNMFELQFHTPMSAENKDKGHILYEKYRVSKEGPERDKMAQEMKEMWNGYTIPRGIEQLPGELM